MKKFFYIAALLFTAAFSLSSCGGDDDEPKATATATYTLTFSQDLIDACNVVIYFKAENGSNRFETPNGTWWSKTVTSDKFPAEFGVMYKFSSKPIGELKKEKYDLAFDVNIAIKTSTGSAFSTPINIFDAKEVSKDKVESFINGYSGKSTGYKVTIDGNPTPANNMKYE